MCERRPGQRTPGVPSTSCVWELETSLQDAVSQGAVPCCKRAEACGHNVASPARPRLRLAHAHTGLGSQPSEQRLQRPNARADGTPGTCARLHARPPAPSSRFASLVPAHGHGTCVCVCVSHARSHLAGACASPGVQGVVEGLHRRCQGHVRAAARAAGHEGRARDGGAHHRLAPQHHPGEARLRAHPTAPARLLCGWRAPPSHPNTIQVRRGCGRLTWPGGLTHRQVAAPAAPPVLQRCRAHGHGP